MEPQPRTVLHTLYLVLRFCTQPCWVARVVPVYPGEETGAQEAAHR